MQPVSSHRSGPLKQSNKSHKTGKHRSKGAVDTENKGRVAGGVKGLTKSGRGHHWVQKRLDRKHRMSQRRSLKKAEIWAQKRALGSLDSAPILTALIDGQRQNAGAVAALEARLSTCDPENGVTRSDSSLHLMVPRFKQRFAFVHPPQRDLLATLDAAKICDSVVFLCSALETEGYGLDSRSEAVLAAILAQGLPTQPVFVLTDLADLSVKRQNEAKKGLLKALNQRFAVDKIHTCHNESEAILLLRHLGAQKRRINSLRDRRAHLLAERLEFLGDSALGTLKVTGYVRSQTLSANRLVHIPGVGSYQVEKIESARDPHAPEPKRGAGDMEDMAEPTGRVIATPHPDLQEPLETENEPEMFEGEQYLSADDEAMATAGPGSEDPPQPAKQVPKGTSAYQAAWIMDPAESQDDDSESENDEEEDEGMEAAEIPAEEESEGEEDGEEYETLTVGSEANLDDNYDEKHVNFDEERALLHKMKDARAEAMFPDEVDTPLGQLAKDRFQKYRGLKSFRTSPWDRYENLCPDYSRIFQFENFNRTKKRVLAEELDGAEPGWYVSVYIKDVPQHLALELLEAEELGPVVVYSQLPHESKMSVLNLVVKRSSLGHQNPIKSKERLIFHVGFRRFAACPIFSQHTNSDKHKVERFWRQGSTVVMTMYAPITFPPSNVLVYQESVDGRHELVGTGSLLKVDPSRLVIKRVVLSGAPFKVQKRGAVIRFMFFNREDILWFKPVELRTKYGRRGHIKEPLGTHGHMKCIFDQALSQQDTVMLNLFKRVFPKWTYDPFVGKPRVAEDVMEEEGQETLQLGPKAVKPKPILKSQPGLELMACD